MLSLHLNEHHAMNKYWVKGGIAPISAQDEGEWSTSCPSCFTPWVRAPSTHWTEGWVGPISDKDIMAKRKNIAAPARN